jgi:hypothetical protein
MDRPNFCIIQYVFCNSLNYVATINSPYIPKQERDMRFGREVDNQVVLLEENLVVPQAQDSGSNEERNVEPSKATHIVEDPPKSTNNCDETR